MVNFFLTLNIKKNNIFILLALIASKFLSISVICLSNLVHLSIGLYFSHFKVYLDVRVFFTMLTYSWKSFVMFILYNLIKYKKIILVNVIKGYM